MVYVRQYELPKLKEYKYSSADHSLVSYYILRHFYNAFVELFPMSMAPNLVTLTGFGFVVINFLTMLWYNPTLDQDMPPWVYVSWAVGLFLYQTFDAVDGKQARRTGQSGPLGELFDHSVDACNTILEVILFAAATNLGQGWETAFTLMGCALTFYVQTWEEYYTQTLTLGIVSGPVEGVLTLCVVFMATAYLGGGSFWQRPMFPTLGVANFGIPEELYELPFSQAFMVLGGAILVFNTVSSAYTVMTIKSPAPHTRGKCSPLWGLVPGVGMWVVAFAYLYMNPVILKYHLVPFVVYAGLINAYSVGRIITAHLTKQPQFPYFNVLVIPLFLAVVDGLGSTLEIWPSVLGNSMYQLPFMFACLGLSVGVYGSFVYDIITTICDYLDIWCLTIKYPQKKTETKKLK